MTTPHPEQPAEGTDDVPAEDPGSDDPDSDPAAVAGYDTDDDPDGGYLVEQPDALDV